MEVLEGRGNKPTVVGQRGFSFKLARISSVAKVFVWLVTMATASDALVRSSFEEAALKHVTTGTNKFALSLYRELTKGNTGNVFVSPLSVQMVLALTYSGAKGNTAKEIGAALSLSDRLNETHAGYHGLVKSLQDPVLKLANRMFVESSAPVKLIFQSAAERFFFSPAESVNFIRDPENTRRYINFWVEYQTNKKITNLLAPGTISASTRLVLVNAIHFKANWKLKFDNTKTKQEPFHISKTKTVPVQMMHIKSNFGFEHNDDLKAKILRLDYDGNNFHMIIVLPDEIDGLARVEAELEKSDFFNQLNDLEEPIVTVSIPKFKLEETMELNDVLESMGMKTMFQDAADFSGLSDEPLVVSDVVQKAFVEVNEEGTEAAAASASVMQDRMDLGPSLPDQVFVADHPFVFFILSKKTKRPLPVFAGRLVNP